MKEKEETNSRITGLFGIIKERKKFFSGVNTIFSTLFSVIGLIVGILVINQNLVTGILIIVISIIFSISFFGIYVIVDALRVEKEAIETIIQYLDKLVKEYGLKKMEYNLIEREMEIGFPREKDWYFETQNTLYWLSLGIQKNAHIFIEGLMGIGKSILSLALAHKLAKEAKEKLNRREYKDIRIPLLIPLGNSKYFADKIIANELSGRYRTWIKDIICMDLEIEEEQESTLENYIKHVYKDLSIFSLIYDGFDEFRFKKLHGKLAPLTLFKHEDKDKTWRGAVILTSRPFVLDKVEKELLQESKVNSNEFGLSLQNYEQPFGFAKLPVFSDEESWKYISQNRPIIKSIDKKQFEEKIKIDWQNKFGDDWRIPLYLWSISSYEDYKEIPNNKKELFYSIFSLHFGWYYWKKDIHTDKSRKKIEEKEYREYTNKTEECNILPLYADYWIKPVRFHDWQKEILAEIALYLSEKENEEDNKLSENEYDKIIKKSMKRITEILDLTEEEKLTYPACFKETIKEGTYVFCSSYQEEDYSFSPRRMQEMFTVIKFLSLPNEDCVNSLKKILAHYDINKETIKLFWELKEEENDEEAKKIFISAFPAFSVLREIAEQNKINVNRLFDGIKISSSLELQELSLVYYGLTNIDLTPLKGCTQLQALDLESNNLAHIDLTPLKGCTELQRLGLGSNNLEHIDLTPLKGCTQLQALELWSGNFEHIDLTPLKGCTQLQALYLGNNNLEHIDLTPLEGCTQLKKLDLRSISKLEKIDISPLVQNPHLDWFLYIVETTHLICDEKLIDKIQSPALLAIKEIIEPIKK